MEYFTCSVQDGARCSTQRYKILIKESILSSDFLISALITTDMNTSNVFLINRYGYMPQLKFSIQLGLLLDF